MSHIVIVGAGGGLGRSIAALFGRHDFSVSLIARSQTKLDALADELAEMGIEAAGFSADIMDRSTLTLALDRAVDRFGDIDVLEYSPAPHSPVPGIMMAAPLDVTVANMQPQIDFYLHGGITVAQHVLPSMLERGSGTLLFTTGASSVRPNARMGNVGPAAAALRNWVLSLHEALSDTDVYAAHVPLDVWIGSGGPQTQPEAIAELYWTLYQERAGGERMYIPTADQ